MRTHWLLRVTPGRSPVRAMDAPLIRLVNVDLPTFGTPTIITRTVFLTPFAAILATASALAFSMRAMISFALPRMLSKLMQSIPCARKYPSHARVSRSSAKSALPSTSRWRLF